MIVGSVTEECERAVIHIRMCLRDELLEVVEEGIPQWSSKDYALWNAHSNWLLQ